METIAFKPYACGTMTQPFIDCAIKLADDGVRAEDITDIVCEVAEGTVHRLWEPLAVEAPAAHAVCGEVQHALLHGGRLSRSQGRPRAVQRGAHPRSRRAGAGREDSISDQSGRRISAQLHRPPARDAEGRQPAGIPPAPPARRRARAAFGSGAGRRSSWTTRAMAAGAPRWRSGCMRLSRATCLPCRRSMRSTEFRA